jgi:hypothetical protein
LEFFYKELKLFNIMTRFSRPFLFLSSLIVDPAIRGFFSGNLVMAYGWSMSGNIKISIGDTDVNPNPWRSPETRNKVREV